MVDQGTLDSIRSMIKASQHRSKRTIPKHCHTNSVSMCLLVCDRNIKGKASALGKLSPEEDGIQVEGSIC